MEKDVYVKIGERLRKQRRIMGLTQEQAAGSRASWSINHLLWGD